MFHVGSGVVVDAFLLLAAFLIDGQKDGHGHTKTQPYQQTDTRPRTEHTCTQSMHQHTVVGAT